MLPSIPFWVRVDAAASCIVPLANRIRPSMAKTPLPLPRAPSTTSSAASCGLSGSVCIGSWKPHSDSPSASIGALCGVATPRVLGPGVRRWVVGVFKRVEPCTERSSIMSHWEVASAVSYLCLVLSHHTIGRCGNVLVCIQR